VLDPDPSRLDMVALRWPRAPEYGAEVLFRSPRAAMVRDPDGQRLELLTMDYRRRVEADGDRPTG